MHAIFREFSALYFAVKPPIYLGWKRVDGAARQHTVWWYGGKGRFEGKGRFDGKVKR